MGANTSDSEFLDGLGRGRGRGRGRGIALLVKQQTNDAGSVVWSDFYFDAVASGSYTLTAATGSYALSGQSANLLKSRVLSAATGGYALNGVAAGLARSRLLTANTGAYVHTGVAANIIYTPAANAYVLTANAGSYAFSGVGANLLRSRLLTGAAGSYALTGVSAGIAKSKKLTANTGTYTLAGNAATISYTPNAGAYTLTAETGAYSLAGNDATITTTATAAPSFNGGFVMRTRKVYIKRGKQYLIFNNNAEADSYLAAEEAIETAKKSSRGAAKRKLKALKVVKPEIAPEPKLEEIETLLAKFDVKFDISKIIDDIDSLYQIQYKLYELQQDEEDIELLLLSL